MQTVTSLFGKLLKVRSVKRELTHKCCRTFFASSDDDGDDVSRSSGGDG
jgi:hypothetical protein